MSIEIKSILISTWNNFPTLMQSDSQCSDCWCLNHRALSGCPTGNDAKNEMKQLVSNNKVHGLLAYINKECIGWLAIDPMINLIGHDCQNTAKEDEWSIHCLFIKDGFRRQGISKELIQAAINYAKNQNAKIVSAFPIPSENREQFPLDEAEFSGRFTTFTKQGFKSIGTPSDFYQRVELELDHC